MNQIKEKDKAEKIILAIETSCDETSVAVIKNGRQILSNIISSQIDIHKDYGGVVPEIASRHHLENMNIVIDEALETAGISLNDIDVIGVTKGPGLVGALLVGLSTAKALALALKKPLIGVHHIKGHICANYLEHPDLKPPFLSLVVSGGHTHIIDVKDYDRFQVLGQTRDDAIGEAYDKVARVLGLGYPGGPKIDKIAKTGNSDAIAFPRTYLEQGSLDFSFSGIKTAVLNYINAQKQKGNAIHNADVAASFQMAAVEVIIKKVLLALEQTGRNSLAMAGGVAANSLLRSMLKKTCEEAAISLYYPSIELCTDNAAMIGCAAYYDYINGKQDNLNLDAYPSLSFLD
ncbi:MAG: tRNA (adenosine(37)-N6)-threonylcarbamoyltransferase complex transferase subunit TsaD [Clostridia bacterium]|nr:tRNA (adenosine(37)-N6)-threonylcarbamoyltransferase complex transferase subunit TsaD [Clostridia bacterium]